MNRHDTTPTPSELVYLFVDGEATDVETSLLFGALADDAELQAELADAIRINAAAQGEAFETLPPADVTGALFERAGMTPTVGNATMGAAGAAGAAAIGLDGASGSNNTSGAAYAPVAGTAARRSGRRFGLPMLAGFLGMMLALLLVDVTDPFGRDGDPLQQSSPMAVAGEKGDLSTSGESIVGSNDDARLSQGLTAGRSGSGDHGSLSDPGSAVTTRSNSSGRATTSRSNGGPGIDDRIGNNERGVETLGDVTSTNTIGSHDATVNAANESDPNALVAADQNIRERANYGSDVTTLDHSLASRSFITPIRRPAPTASVASTVGRDHPLAMIEPVSRPNLSSDLSLVVRGGGGVGLYPLRSATSIAPAEEFDNLALGLLWRFDENHAFGFLFSRDYHPLYIDNGAGGGSILRTPGNGSGGGSGGGGQTPVINGTGNGNGGGGVIDLNGGAGGFAGGESIDESGPTVNYRGDTISKSASESAGSELDRTVEWAGVLYRFRADALDSRGIVRPQFEAAVGAAASGPVGRTFAGLALSPGGPVTLTAGVEASGLLYRRDGTWYSSRSIGLEYGLEISW